MINANDYDELSQMMIIDQILSNTTPELQIWLREHTCTTVTELTKQAETIELLGRVHTRDHIRTGVNQTLTRLIGLNL